MRKVKESNLCRIFPPSVFKTAPLPSLATFLIERMSGIEPLLFVLQTNPKANIRYILRCGGQWNRTITGLNRNILAGCRNKPSFAYPPIVGNIGFEPIAFQLFRIYSPAPLHHRDGLPNCSHSEIRTHKQQILSLSALPVSLYSFVSLVGVEPTKLLILSQTTFPFAHRDIKNASQ